MESFRWSLLSPSRGTEHRVSPRAYDTRVDGLPIFRIVREYPPHKKSELRASSNGSESGVRSSLRTKAELSSHQMARKLRGSGFTPAQNPPR